MDQVEQQLKHISRNRRTNDGGRVTHFSRGRCRSWSVIVLVFNCLGVAVCAQAQSPDDPSPAVSPGAANTATGATISAIGRSEAEAGTSSSDTLPNAPAPIGDETGITPDSRSGGSYGFGSAGAYGSVVSTRAPGYVSLDQCPDDTTHARSCRVHWRQLLISTSTFNAFQNVGNLYTGYWYRWETTHGKWFDSWINSAAGWRWNVWSDQNPFLDDYVGHPMMGAITNSLWIQNDPKGMTVDFGNTPEYWHSRMRAFVFSTAYSFEWKLGPFGEAGIGQSGDHLVPQGGNRPYTNETGWVELVTTPAGGLLWTMAEDALDKHVISKIEERPRGPLPLLLISFLTPARATANIFRFRPPWYRDGRNVANNSFFSEPGAPSAHVNALVSTTKRGAETLPEWPHYGGAHEFGAWWGLSLVSGPIWGYDKDVKYMPVDLTYSYRFLSGTKWNFRYAPEMTALAMLDEPNPAATDRLNQRKRTYGSGVSPVGLRASFLPESRVQPFFSTDGGFIYFVDRVLSPQGSQFMYTIDFGGGIQIFRKARQALSIGYRYQHLSNANISLHNPGTDANTFYVAVSRFRTKHYR
jgi:hypothetical protein